MDKRSHSLREVISRNIKAARIKTSLTQKELADRVGIKVQYISRLETNPQNITVDLLEKIAEGLGSSVHSLLGESRKISAGKKNNIEELDQAIQLLRAYKSRL